MFIDLTAAYDTVNTQVLLQKIYNRTRDFRLTQIIGCLLENRSRLVVDFQRKRSRTIRNGLPQGSFLAPMLFNIHNDNQPISTHTRSFADVDDLAVTAQETVFELVEERLRASLNELRDYYEASYLKPNPTKTQLCVFYLRNKDANRRLRVEWNGSQLEHHPAPKYLGITLDRILSFNKHCHNIKINVSSRNNLLRKITFQLRHPTANGENHNACSMLLR